jgi:biofilm PGA synthesis N-glycosyltransferase PgaC
MNPSESRAARPIQPDQEAKYVLMTAAHNEADNIARTVESIASQTILPDKWLIVSDNSTDGTDEILESYASRYNWIHFLRVSRQPGRSFASKVLALKAGARYIENIPCGFIGNIDGDVTVEPVYYESLMARFTANPTLGIVGGFVYDRFDGEFKNRENNDVHSVAHAGQLVRRQCYDDIGGYAVLKYGGEDWHAQVSARIKGWGAQAFPDLKIFHYRPTGTKGNLLNHVFQQGRLDYSLGSYPLFEFIKCFKRISQKPLIIGAMARFMGFCWSWLIREARPVSAEFIAFLQGEQKGRVRSMFRRRKERPRLHSE